MSIFVAVAWREREWPHSVRSAGSVPRAAGRSVSRARRGVGRPSWSARCHRPSRAGSGPRGRPTWSLSLRTRADRGSPSRRRGRAGCRERLGHPGRFGQSSSSLATKDRRDSAVVASSRWSCSPTSRGCGSCDRAAGRRVAELDGSTVAYVENLKPRSQSNFSTARRSPNVPSWTSRPSRRRGPGSDGPSGAQSQVGRDHLLLGLFVAGRHALGEFDLFVVVGHGVTVKVSHQETQHVVGIHS